ncbi:MAG: helix-turn-helix domain-containing protein [Candidatus Hydrogenedentes bacterium]|nr:helix-turn-helix domain-containing protein [Candidatus Hydrogenedentota bacterium]
MADEPKPAFPDVMTVEQLAAYLQLHPQVVYRHVRDGKIPVSKIGQTLRFPKAVIDAWLEEEARRSVGLNSPSTPDSSPWDMEHD